MRTIILPGMGADSAMYPRKHYAGLHDICCVDWPEYRGETTLREVAGRTITEYGITEDMAVGGASLGGMVAIEIAKILKIRKVILIGSAISPQYINRNLRALSSLSFLAPFKLTQYFAGQINRNSGNDLLAMFQRSDPRFIRAMCGAISRWEGLDAYDCRLSQIHGKLDAIIYPPERNCLIIEDGGHLISMTHGDRVADFLSDSLRS